MRPTSIVERATGFLGRDRDAGWRAPIACGAVGDFDPARVAALAALMPGSSKREIDGSAALWLDREPICWSGESAHGFAWSESPANARTSALHSRKAIARDAAAAGIEIDGERVTLHGSGLGMQPLYVHREGRATYFCSRLAPLADAAPAPLGIDWAAWSSIFEFGCPLGVRTGFAGIERIEPGCWISHAARGAEGVAGSDGWSWEEVETGAGADPAGDILDAIRASVEAVPTPRGRAVCPLSGGWDSRLIAYLLADAGTKVRSLTINTDAGHEIEESLAAPVAAGLGIDHELVTTRNSEYWQHWRAAAASQEHQSPIHLPMQALAASIPRGPDPIFDGVSGDVLIKGWWVDKRILGAPTWHRATRMLWRRFRLNREGLRLFSAHHAEAVRHSARAQFMAEARRFDGHDSAPTLFITWARSRRSTAPSPFDLFGARGPAALPFASDAVARAALAVPLQQKLGGALYREVLARADKRLASWPSTSDVGASADERHRRRRTLSGVAVKGYREMLREHPLRPSFSGTFEQQVESGKIRHLLRHRQGLVALDTLCRFSDWHARHADSLKPFEPADLKQL